MRTTSPLLVQHGDHSVSAAFRAPTPGPEFDMLYDYLQHALPHPERSEQMAVFIEPIVETGCPDAVAVYWKRAEIPEREAWDSLGPSDDDLLQFIWVEPGVDCMQIERSLGKQAAIRARELVALGFLTQCDGYLAVREDGLVLSRVLAIEAKISGPAAVLSQAARNTWFATESYALMPTPPTAQRLCDRYRSCGVGIVTPDAAIECPTVAARKWGLPQSRLTWRFNRLALEVASGLAVA